MLRGIKENLALQAMESFRTAIKMSREKIEAELRRIDELIRACTLCPRREPIPKVQPSFAFRGKQAPLFVGRDPAKSGWRESGRLFRDRKDSLIASGKVLNDQLEVIGHTVDSISFVELLKCHPADDPRRRPTKKEVGNCGRWLRLQIEVTRPPCVVTLGKEATAFFVGSFDELGSVVGRVFRYSDIPVIPLYHPSPRNRRYGHRNSTI